MEGKKKKKTWMIFCFISLLITLTNKAPLPSEDGGRIGNSHPFRAKNKYLLMIWIVWWLETAAALEAYTTWKEVGADFPWLGPGNTRVKIKLTFWKGTLRNLCLWFPSSHPTPNFLRPVLNCTWGILSTYSKLNILYFLLGLKVD